MKQILFLILLTSFTHILLPSHEPTVATLSLWLAIAEQKANNASAALDNNASILTTDENGDTALHMASRQSARLVQVLFKKSRRDAMTALKKRNKSRQIPFQCARVEGKDDILIFFQEQTKKPNKRRRKKQETATKSKVKFVHPNEISCGTQTIKVKTADHEIQTEISFLQEQELQKQREQALQALLGMRQ